MDKRAKAPKKRSLIRRMAGFEPMEWRQEYYRDLTSRLILRLGCLFILGVIAMAVANVTGLGDWVGRIALASAVVLGAMVGGVGVVLLLNRREKREEPADGDSQESA